MLNQWAFIAVILLMGSSLTLLLSQNWRIYIISLAVQYLAVFWLVSLSWSFGLAAVKLIAGWMAGAVLGASQPALDMVYEDRSRPSGTLFRFLAAVMVWIIVYSIAPVLESRLPAGTPVLWGSLILVGMGLLQLGMTTRPIRVIVGLLTVLSGFEILYATMESSVLVTGLLVMVNLGLALVGALILVSPGSESLS